MASWLKFTCGKSEPLAASRYLSPNLFTVGWGQRPGSLYQHARESEKEETRDAAENSAPPVGLGFSQTPVSQLRAS